MNDLLIRKVKLSHINDRLKTLRQEVYIKTASPALAPLPLDLC